MDFRDILKQLSAYGEPGFMVVPPKQRETHCPVMVEECCRAVHEVMSLLNELDGMSHVPYEKADAGALKEINKHVVSLLEGRPPKLARSLKDRYRQQIAFAATIRAARRHVHQGH
jgi:hypothetical protein